MLKDKRKVLIVDDSENNREILRRFLEREECLVEIAVGGSEAIKIFGHNYFDLVLIDIQMPGMDGVTLLNKLRSSIKERKIQCTLVGCTALELDEYDHSGFDRLLKKPVSKKLVYELLNKV